MNISLLLSLCFLLFIKRFHATPVIVGDRKPGLMFGLHSQLGSEYWIPSECKLNNSLQQHPKFQGRKFKWRGPQRPKGWEIGALVLGEEILNATIAKLALAKGQEFCPYLTRQCCMEEKLYSEHSELVNITNVLKKRGLVNCETLAWMPRNSLGSCAFVAPGSSLLRVPMGSFIDEHDTVLRLGHEPLKDWSKYTGIKTTAVIGKKNWEKRAKSKRKLEARQNKASRDITGISYKFGQDSQRRSYERGNRIKFISDFGATKEMPEQLTLSNGQKYWIGSVGSLHKSLYRAMTVPAKGRIKRARSTGYEEVLKLLFSGLCSRIDVFGLTANCGGYYHEREHVMSVHHSCELESWSLHHIMRYYKAESSRLCVWI